MSTQTFTPLPWPATAHARRSRAPPTPGAAAGTVLYGPVLRTLFPPAPHRQRRPRKPRKSCQDPSKLLLLYGPRGALDVALVPEREGEQPPELAAEILAARHVVVDQARHGLRAEEALAAKRLGRK